MKTILPGVLAASTLASALAAAQPQGETRSAILEAARKPVVTRLGKSVKFKVIVMEREGDWVFLRANMLDAQGKPISFIGTPLAADAREGMVSRDYAAVLQNREGIWVVVDKAIGPTDVAWEGWSAKYGAPPAIFGN